MPANEAETPRMRNKVEKSGSNSSRRASTGDSKSYHHTAASAKHAANAAGKCYCIMYTTLV